MKVLKYAVICCLISMFAAFPIAFMVSSQTPPLIALQPFVSGLSSPLLVTNAKDSTRRLFIVQQGGIIKVVQPGSNTPTDFLNITSRIVSGGERGLLGLTFHPEFATNGYFFVNYTRAGDGATIIARYKTTDGSNALGDPNSEKILLTIAQPFTNHNGGMIEFGPDGNLYIGMGDGGSANDPGNRAQNLNELLGKFLRITPTLDAGATTPAYTIPADNPFVGVNGADEIYAFGMRNPFRWSFDRGGTRQLWAGDVGQGALEEVDIITRGGNYGWRIMEGSQCNPNINGGACTPPPGHIPPIFEYSSASPSSRCSITGGYVYRGTQATLPDGAYIYGDYCTGEILLWNNNQQILLLDTTRNISSFGEDEDGELYVVGLGGTVEKIIRTQTPTPTPVATPTPTPTPVATPTPTPNPTPTPTPQTCTPVTTVTEGDLFPGGISSFGVSSGPGTVTIDHVNAGTGTQSISVVGAPTNAVVNIPPFAPGTFNPVVVTFTTPSPALAVDFTLRAASTYHAIFIRVRCVHQ